MFSFAAVLCFCLMSALFGFHAGCSFMYYMRKEPMDKIIDDAWQEAIRGTQLDERTKP